MGVLEVKKACQGEESDLWIDGGKNLMKWL